MTFRSALLILLGLTVAGVAPARAQVVRGMVWNPPPRPELAEADLKAMAEMGVEAVRTPLLQNERLYRLADSLGLALYQDLPFAYMAAGELVDTMRYAGQVVQEALWWAETHPSARHFGLARLVDTSDEAACAFLETLTERFRSRPGNTLQLYYLTAFVKDDRCAGAVDFVLLDALDTPDPLALLRRWQEARPATPAGIGQLGVWVRERDEEGTLVPNSQAYQARYLERNLNLLLADTLTHPPLALFVYRWRDRRFDRPSPAHDLASPYRDAYGLQTRAGEQRLAEAVVTGIFTGGQTVFAFPTGRPPPDAPPWVILMGWGVLLLLGYVFFHYTRFQTMVRRYFVAHGFYRESLGQGRETLTGPNALVLSALFVAAGLINGVILEAVREKPAFAMLVRSLPESMALSVVAVLGRPLTITLVLGGLFGFGMMIWTSVLAALSSRGRHTMFPGQELMLVAWPRWTLLTAMVAAMVVSTLGPQDATPPAVALALVSGLSALAAALRTLNDYRAITRAGLSRMLFAVLGNPLFLLVIACVYLALRYMPRIVFLVHLAVHG